MSESRRSILKQLGILTGTGVVLSSELLARLSTAAAAAAPRTVAGGVPAGPQEPACPHVFYDGDNCGVEGGNRGFICGGDSFICQGGPADDFECYGTGFACQNDFDCLYSFDGCNVVDQTFQGTGGFDDCQPLFGCALGAFSCPSGHSSS